jgi:hypothetical protein
MNGKYVWHIEEEKFLTYATMSDTSFCVGTIDSLKKLMTTELNLSRSSGYRLKDDCRKQDQT